MTKKKTSVRKPSKTAMAAAKALLAPADLMLAMSQQLKLQAQQLNQMSDRIEQLTQRILAQKAVPPIQTLLTEPAPTLAPTSILTETQ